MSAEDWMLAIKFIVGAIAYAFALAALGHFVWRDEDERADGELL